MENLETIVVIIFTVLTLTNHWWAEWVLRRKIITYLLFPLILLMLWIGLMLYQAYKIESVITILTTEYSRNHLIMDKTGEIHKGDKVIGEFTATNNYLGIVGFRFWTYVRLNDDYIIFRIKQKGSNNWYYQNKYKEDQFQPDQYFTFGFPNINDSQGKIYDFEIESLQGQPGESVAVSGTGPTFIAKYKYPKELVLSSYRSTIYFALLKVINLAGKAQFKASAFVYLLPFIIYIISLTPFFLIIEKKIKNNISKIRIQTIEQKLKRFTLIKLRFGSKEIVIDCLSRQFLALFLITLGILGDIFMIKVGDMTIIVLVFLTYFSFNYYKYAENLLLIYAFVFLSLSGLFYYLSMDQISERIGVWSWLFLVLTVIFVLSPSRKYSETRKNKKNI